MRLVWILKSCARLLCLIVAVATLLTFFRSENINNKHVLHVATGNRLTSFLYPESEIPAYNTNSQINYDYPKLQDFVQMFQSRYTSNNSIFALRSAESYNVFLKRLNFLAKKGQMLVKKTKSPTNTSSSRFYRGINQQRLYDPNNEQLLQDLLQDMATLPIISAVKVDAGSQLKMALTFSDGTRARMKLMRLSREVESSMNVFEPREFERHFSEIAGFHVDKVLGFNRAIPTVGRVFNITNDLRTFLFNNKYELPMYRSPAGNLCFVATCAQYCGPDYPFCGHPDVIEGSVTVELPSVEQYKIVALQNPYVRSYNRLEKAPWETDENYCMNYAKHHTSLIGSRSFLDIIDYLVYDFLIGNADRHNFKMFEGFGNESFPIIMDNGRGFRFSNYDDPRGLVPIQQCCEIRLSTLAKLMKLYIGPDSLSQRVRTSMSSDPVSPVLLEPHLQALDRRLLKIIKAVSDCVSSGKPWDYVVIDDGII